jgi:hypothetical protein
VVLAATAAVAGGSVACNVLIGADQFSVCNSLDDAGWHDGGWLDGLEANCCDQAAACAADPGCSVRQSCLLASVPLLACPLVGGVEASAGNQPYMVTGPATALASCVASSCEVTCGGEPWACVPGVSSSPASANDGDAGVTITINPTFFSGSLTPPLGPAVTIKQVSVCRAPMACAKPIPNSTGMPGPFAIPGPLLFGSYLDVVAEPVDGGDAPLEALVYLSWVASVDTTIDLRFLTLPLLTELAKSGGVVSFDPDAGTLVVLARNCVGDPAAGVTLTFWNALMPNPGLHSAGFTFMDGVPGQAVAQEPDPDAAPVVTTTADGVAGWVDMTPGLTANFTASIDGGAAIAQMAPITQAGSVTYVWLTPVPSGSR